MELGNELEVKEGWIGFIPNDCGALNAAEGRPNGIKGTKWNKLSKLSFYQSFGG